MLLPRNPGDGVLSEKIAQQVGFCEERFYAIFELIAETFVVHPHVLPVSFFRILVAPCDGIQIVRHDRVSQKFDDLWRFGLIN